MIDRESVIFRLENWGKTCPWHNCVFCGESNRCTNPTIRDALELLKDQDEGIAPIESTTEQKKFADRFGLAVSDFWCGECHFNLLGHPKFCPNCGKKVKWNE